MKTEQALNGLAEFLEHQPKIDGDVSDLIQFKIIDLIKSAKQMEREYYIIDKQSLESFVKLLVKKLK